jgi:hypothetical protein
MDSIQIRKDQGKLDRNELDILCTALGHGTILHRRTVGLFATVEKLYQITTNYFELANCRYDHLSYPPK